MSKIALSQAYQEAANIVEGLRDGYLTVSEAVKQFEHLKDRLPADTNFSVPTEEELEDQHQADYESSYQSSY